MPRQGRSRKTKKNSGERSYPPKYTLGSLMSPVNVTSLSDVAPALKRIKNASVTLVLIYAKWCGHCHTYMPFFDKMGKTAGRTANTVKIEESALNKFNTGLMKNFPGSVPLEAEGYPTLLAVSKNGTVMSNLPVVREEAPNTKMIKSVGEIVRSMPEPTRVANVSVATPNVAPVNISSRGMDVMEMSNNFAPLTTAGTSAKPSSGTVLPPNVEEDFSPKVERLTGESEPLPPIPTKVVGGNGLYGALVDATYQLAPAAILTGVAAGIPRILRRPLKRSTRRMSRRRA